MDDALHEGLLLDADLSLELLNLFLLLFFYDFFPPGFFV
jgi:hypothetical protein